MREAREALNRIVREGKKRSIQAFEAQADTIMTLKVTEQQDLSSNIAKFFQELGSIIKHDDVLQKPTSPVSISSPQKAIWTIGSVGHDIKHLIIKKILGAGVSGAIQGGAQKVDKTWKGWLLGTLVGNVVGPAAEISYDLTDDNPYQKRLNQLEVKLDAFQKDVVNVQVAPHYFPTVAPAILESWRIASNDLIANFIYDDFVDQQELNEHIKFLLQSIINGLADPSSYSKGDAHKLAKIYFTQLATILEKSIVDLGDHISLPNKRTLSGLCKKLRSDDFLTSFGYSRADQQHKKLDEIINFFKNMELHADVIVIPTNAGFQSFIAMLDYPLGPDAKGHTADEKFAEIICIIMRLIEKRSASTNSTEKTHRFLLQSSHQGLLSFAELEQLYMGETLAERFAISPRLIVNKELLNDDRVKAFVATLAKNKGKLLEKGFIGSALWDDPRHFSFKTTREINLNATKEVKITHVVTRQEIYREQLAQLLGYPIQKVESIKTIGARGLENLQNLLSETTDNINALEDNANEYKRYVLLQLIDYYEYSLSNADARLQNELRGPQLAAINQFLNDNFQKGLTLEKVAHECRHIYGIDKEPKQRIEALEGALKRLQLQKLLDQQQPSGEGQALLSEEEAKKLLQKILADRAQVEFFRLQDFLSNPDHAQRKFSALHTLSVLWEYTRALAKVDHHGQLQACFQAECRALIAALITDIEKNTEDLAILKAVVQHEEFIQLFGDHRAKLNLSPNIADIPELTFQEHLTQIIYQNQRASFTKLQRGARETMMVEVLDQQAWSARVEKFFGLLQSKIKKTPSYSATTVALLELGSVGHSIKHAIIRKVITAGISSGIEFGAETIDHTWKGWLVGAVTGTLVSMTAGIVFDAVDQDKYKQKLEKASGKLDEFQKEIDNRFSHHPIQTFLGLAQKNAKAINQVSESVLESWRVATNELIANFILDDFVDQQELEQHVSGLLNHIIAHLCDDHSMNHADAYQKASLYFTELADLLQKLISDPDMPISEENKATIRGLCARLTSDKNLLFSVETHSSGDSQHLKLDKIIEFLKNMESWEGIVIPEDTYFCELVRTLDYPLSLDFKGRSANVKFTEITTILGRLSAKRKQSIDENPKELQRFLLDASHRGLLEFEEMRCLYLGSPSVVQYLETFLSSAHSPR